MTLERTVAKAAVDLLKAALLSELRKPREQHELRRRISVICWLLGLKDTEGTRRMLQGVFQMLKEEGKADLDGNEWTVKRHSRSKP